MSVPSRLDTRRRPARVTGGWYAAGGGAEQIGGPGGKIAEAAADEANPGAAGAPTPSVTVVIGVTGVTGTAGAGGAAFGGGGALILGPTAGAAGPPPAD